MTDASAPEPRRIPLSIGITIAVVCGMLMALQVRMNGGLALDLNHGPLAALWSFGSGFVIVVVILVATRAGRSGARGLVVALRERRLPWWVFTGGVIGAFAVLTQGLSAAIIGVALFTVSFVAGQTVGGLVIDRVGVGAPPRRLTLTRVAGSALAVIAVMVAAGGQQVLADQPWLAILPVIAGGGIGLQQAINGIIRRESDSVWAATGVNFVMGTLALAVAAGISVLGGAVPSAPESPPWVWLGGVCGVTFIALQAWLVSRLGVLLLGLGTIAGQLLGALLLDLVLPTEGHVVSIAAVIGTTLALLAVVIASLRGRARGATAG